jgi:cytoskeletal protein RodZ
MTKTEAERLSVVETKVDTVLEEIKAVNSRLDNLDNKFAAKWVQTIVGGLVAAVLLAFIGVVVAYFIHTPTVANSPTTSNTTTTTTPTGSTSTTSTKNTERPADNQSSGGATITLPKVPLN